MKAAYKPKNKKNPPANGRGTKKALSHEFLINNLVSWWKLKVTKQLIGIADHADFLADRIVGHLIYHRFIHLTREITVKGMTDEVAGIRHTANRRIDRWTPDPGGNHQGPAKLIPEPLGKSLKPVADTKTAAAFAGKFIIGKIFQQQLTILIYFQINHTAGPDHSPGLVNVLESILHRHTPFFLLFYFISYFFFFTQGFQCLANDFRQRHPQQQIQPAGNQHHPQGYPLAEQALPG